MSRAAQPRSRSPLTAPPPSGSSRRSPSRASPRGRWRTPERDPRSLRHRHPPLNSRYTFARFIVGASNRLASAASFAVAEGPARRYNPLFLYGDTGLGKTHLLQAIGHALLDRRAGARVCYTPSVEFVNEMVAAIYGNTTEAFRSRYRSFDLLLVDDIQFLGGKERSQEEFFHTFNVLYNTGAQIVLTSDCRPKDLVEMEARLVSRFEWGLVADVSPPDYETRIAILRRKADEERIEISGEIVELIADRCTSSVRELEGALIKLLASHRSPSRSSP